MRRLGNRLLVEGEVALPVVVVLGAMRGAAVRVLLLVDH